LTPVQHFEGVKNISAAWEEVSVNGCQCCLHASQHHITFAANGPGVMATFKGCTLPLSDHYENGKGLGQFGQNYQTLLTLVQHFEGVKNVSAAWEEVSVNCLNGMLCKIIPKFTHIFMGMSHRRSLLKTLAGWHRRQDCMRFQLRL